MLYVLNIVFVFFRNTILTVNHFILHRVRKLQFIIKIKNENKRRKQKRKHKMKVK